MADEVAEFIHRYLGCWGKTKTPKNKAVRPITLADNRVVEGTLGCSLVTRTLSERRVRLPTVQLMEETDWFVPITRLVNVQDYVYGINVSPSRQYRKGLCLEQCGVYMLAGGLPLENPQHANYQIAWNWNKPLPHFTEALYEIMSGNRVSTAFDLNWAVSLYKGIDGPLLYYGERPVGKIIDNKINMLASWMYFKEFLEAQSGMEVVQHENR